MIQCKDCEFYRQEPNGRRLFMCDPFSTIKEPECIDKWQLLRLEIVVSALTSMNAFQARMAPLQDKMFKYIKRELEDIDEADSWKYDEDNDNPDLPQNGFDSFGQDENPEEKP